MKAMRVLVTALAFALGASAAVAQPTTTLREKLVGTWDFVIAEITTANGNKNFPFGERPKGLLIFTACILVLVSFKIRRTEITYSAD